MKKVTINVSSKDYTITLEDGFAKAFQKDLETLTEIGRASCRERVLRLV